MQSRIELIPFLLSSTMHKHVWRGPHRVVWTKKIIIHQTKIRKKFLLLQHTQGGLTGTCSILIRLRKPIQRPVVSSVLQCYFNYKFTYATLSQFPFFLKYVKIKRPKTTQPTWPEQDQSSQVTSQPSDSTGFQLKLVETEFNPTQSPNIWPVQVDLFRLLVNPLGWGTMVVAIEPSA